MFDPVRVARYTTSEHGQWRNNDDLVAAMQRWHAAGGEDRKVLLFNDVHDRLDHLR